MPLQFAIVELVPSREVEPDEPLNSYNSTPIYHPAPQDVAESHPYGYVAIANNAGKRLTPWIEINGYFWKQVSEKVSEKANKPVKGRIQSQDDMLGESLAIGDYVVVGTTDSTDLTLGKVLSFTPKKVIVIVYEKYPKVHTKNPSSLAKVQPHIIYDENQ